MHFTNMCSSKERRKWQVFFNENCISVDIHSLFILLNVTPFALFLVSCLLNLPLPLLTSAILPGQPASVFIPSLNSHTHFLYQPFPAFHPFQIFIYSLLGKTLQIPLFRSLSLHLSSSHISPRTHAYCIHLEASFSTYVMTVLLKSRLI